MQGGRGSARQAKVVKIECKYGVNDTELNDVDVRSGILDSVKEGVKLSEAGYGVVENPVSINLHDKGYYVAYCRHRRSRRSSQLWN